MYCILAAVIHLGDIEIVIDDSVTHHGERGRIKSSDTLNTGHQYTSLWFLIFSFNEKAFLVFKPMFYHYFCSWGFMIVAIVLVWNFIGYFSLNLVASLLCVEADDLADAFTSTSSVTRGMAIIFIFLVPFNYFMSFKFQVDFMPKLFQSIIILLNYKLYYITIQLCLFCHSSYRSKY